ncbi:MAG: hypothetical protein EOO28_14420 [Comamonadaceae bacterium]|nr:MAG: hypothetical protein EOO28_14420 [Comamonadaceae bacterium]
MKKIAILSLVLAAGAAMAQEPNSAFDISPGTFNRAAVQAEYTAAVKSGNVAQTGEVGDFTVPSTGNSPRAVANVRHEARQAARTYSTTFGEV